jgi:preprotein translocase subunit SecG
VSLEAIYPFVVVLHVFLSLALVGIVLMQPGKGADPASAFGGGMSSSVFGPRGPTNVLSQATTGVAVLFMVTSISLALMSNRQTMGGVDVEDELQRLQMEQGASVPSGVAPGAVEGAASGPSDEAPAAGVAAPVVAPDPAQTLDGEGSSE